MEILASWVALVVKNLTANAGDLRNMSSIPGFGRSPEGGHSNPPIFLPGESHEQRSLAGYNYRVTKSRTQLSNLACMQILVSIPPKFNVGPN